MMMNQNVREKDIGRGFVPVTIWITFAIKKTAIGFENIRPNVEV